MSELKKQMDSRLGNYIPEKMNVGRQTRGDDEMVGFIVPQTFDEKWTKARYDKVKSWSSKGVSPLEITNDWKANFMMIKQVRRSESDAVYWRVLHPEGFEFEIGLDNFEYLQENYCIDKGLIVNLEDSLISGLSIQPAPLKLVYEKRNGKWILVDENHRKYIEASNNFIPNCKEHLDILAEIKANEKAAKKDLTRGDQIPWGNGKGETAMFLGTMSAAFGDRKDPLAAPLIKRMKVVRSTYKGWRSHNGTVVADKTRYHFLNSLVVDKIAQQGGGKMTVQEALDEVNHALQQPLAMSGLVADFELPRNATTPVAVWDKKPKAIETVFEPIDTKSLVEGFVPDLQTNQVTHDLPNNIRLQKDSRWHQYYEIQTPNVLLRNKATGEMQAISQRLNNDYGSTKSGFEHGLFRLQIVDDAAAEFVDLCTYVDNEKTINLAARGNLYQAYTRFKENPSKFNTNMYESIKADTQKKIEDADKAKPNGWYFNDEYELVLVTLK